MTMTLQYLPEYKLVLTRVFDRLNNDMIEEHMNAINKLTKDVPDLYECADARDLIHYDVTASDLNDHGSTEQNKPNTRVVILLRPNFAVQHTMASAYVESAQNAREAISVFDDVSIAVPWLFNGTQSDDVLKHIESLIESAAADWRGNEEAAYLLRSPKNAKRLLKAVSDHKKSRTMKGPA